MAEFSRIRVTPAEEEDVVIIAGAVEDSVSAASGAPSEEEIAPYQASVSADVPVPDVAECRAYKETTLEDLRRTSMSGMQKAIVAVAIVAVVAFIIWYVLLR